MSQGTAVYRFTNQPLEAAYFPEHFFLLPFNLQPNVILPAGQVVGQVTSANRADVQTLSQTGNITAGTFQLQIPGFPPTQVLAWNATAGVVQAAINAVIGAGLITVGGGPLPGTPITFTSAGNWQYGPMNVIQIVNPNLTGGVLGIAHTTVGIKNGVVAAYNQANNDGSQNAIGVLQVPVSTDGAGGITYGSQNGIQVPVTGMTANVVTRGYVKIEALTGLDANAVAQLGRIITGSVGGTGILSIY